MNLLVISNIHTPLHSSTSGMELSTMEFLDGLAQIAPKLKINITVMCHEDTSLPKGISHLKVRPQDHNLEYSMYGESSDKWQSLAIEVAYQKAILECKHFDIIHDQSSAFSPTLHFSKGKSPFLRTIRLMAFHPAYSLVTGMESHVVHISEYALTEDNFTSAGAYSVIRDYVSIPIKIETSFKNYSQRFAVSIGRVGPRNGHHLAVQKANEMGIKLYIIGEVINHTYAQNLLKNRSVEILGALNRNTTLAFLKKAKVLFWFPVVPETNGRVVIESLKLGTPVRGNKVGVLYDLCQKDQATLETDGTVFAQQLPNDWPFSTMQVALRYYDIYRKLLG